MAEAKDIAVLGGGFAGSYCANLLGKAGKNVTLFDMGRGVGEIPNETHGKCGSMHERIIDLRKLRRTYR